MSYDALISLASKLNSGQIDLLVEMAAHMCREIITSIDPTSDIVTDEFNANFSNRLLIHHATHEEKFKKKSFEFAFATASRSAGRTATIISSQTNPGTDVVVDGVAFSLKTEASSDIKRTKIVISKLMEARWIRECATPADFAREATNRIVNHLNQYSRILMLRAFDYEGPAVEYQLYEIPKSVLLNIGNLTHADFSPKSKSGGSGAEVKIDGNRAFRLTLDGSVEKVTISGLSTAHCKLHSTWIVPSLVRISTE